MAQKLALAALLLALIAVATANTYTTTITTSVDDDTNQGMQQRCRQEVQGRRFQSCERYLSHRRGGGYFGGREQDEVAERQGSQQEQIREQCCEEIRNVEEQCQCEAIRHAAMRAQQQQQQQQQQQGTFSRQGGQSEQVYQKARELPRECNLRLEQCQFRLVFV